MSAEEKAALRLKNKQEWHRFFCLWPRRVGPNDCRWLETVLRKGTITHWHDGMFWSWEYKELETFYY